MVILLVGETSQTGKMPGCTEVLEMSGESLPLEKTALLTSFLRPDQWRVKLLSTSVKRCSASLKRFKVSLQPANGRGIQRWRPRIGVLFILL